MPDNIIAGQPGTTHAILVCMNNTQRRQTMLNVSWNKDKVVIWKGKHIVRVIYVNGRDVMKVVDEVKALVNRVAVKQAA